MLRLELPNTMSANVVKMAAIDNTISTSIMDTPFCDFVPTFCIVFAPKIYVPE